MGIFLEIPRSFFRIGVCDWFFPLVKLINYCWGLLSLRALYSYCFTSAELPRFRRRTVETLRLRIQWFKSVLLFSTRQWAEVCIPAAHRIKSWLYWLYLARRLQSSERFIHSVCVCSKSDASCVRFQRCFTVNHFVSLVINSTWISPVSLCVAVGRSSPTKKS